MNFRRAFLGATALVLVGLVSPDLAGAGEQSPEPPNIVFVLVDDMSENLYPYMTEVGRLSAEGVTFANYFNATSFCCPSRATFQAGKYPHNTHVRTNGGRDGGFGTFKINDMDTSIGVQLQAAGYRTGLMGKYLNGYKAAGAGSSGPRAFPPNFVPPGWDSWFSGLGYPHFEYDMVVGEEGQPAYTLSNHDIDPADYYTDVLSQHAQDFIRADSTDPFFLVVTPFAPHTGVALDPEGASIAFPAAPRDRANSRQRPESWGQPEFRHGDCGPVSCRDVPWPDTTSPENFNIAESDPLSWMPPAPIATETLNSEGRRNHIQRIQMLQSVNDMLAGIRATLDETGEADNTYIMFTSDNGYHIGEHALLAGKTTAYDHDVRTPLVIRPPGGLRAPVTTAAFVQNTDVLPTVLSLAGHTAQPDVDGVSLLPWMEAPQAPGRTSVLIEMMNDGNSGSRYFDPDLRGEEARYEPPTFNALRTPTYLYIDYSTIDKTPPPQGSAEYYDLASDPGQINNLYTALKKPERQELNRLLQQQTLCVGAQCAELQGLTV